MKEINLLKVLCLCVCVSVHVFLCVHVCFGANRAAKRAKPGTDKTRGAATRSEEKQHYLREKT